MATRYRRYLCLACLFEVFYDDGDPIAGTAEDRFILDENPVVDAEGNPTGENTLLQTMDTGSARLPICMGQHGRTVAWDEFRQGYVTTYYQDVDVDAFLVAAKAAAAKGEEWDGPFIRSWMGY